MRESLPQTERLVSVKSKLFGLLLEALYLHPGRHLSLEGTGTANPQNHKSASQREARSNQGKVFDLGCPSPSSLGYER